jgi:hypothetical protein
MPAPTAPHSDLGWYIQAFFQKFPTLASRPAHRVFAGAYVEGGQAVTRFGTQRTPRFTLRVGRTPRRGPGRQRRHPSGAPARWTCRCSSWSSAPTP